MKRMVGVFSLIVTLIVGIFAGVALTYSSGLIEHSTTVTTTSTSTATNSVTTSVFTTSERVITSTKTTSVTVTTSETSTGATVFVTNVSFPHTGTNGTMAVSNIGIKVEQISAVGLNYSKRVCIESCTRGPIIHTGSSVTLTVTYVASGQPCGVQANLGSAFSGFALFADGGSVPFSGVFG